MKWSVVLTVAAVMAGLTAMVTAFIGGSSPYVTVEQAKSTRGDNLHLAGDIVPGSLSTDVRNSVIRFQIKDDSGDLMWIEYKGAPPSNMGAATRVVAVGGMEGGEFHSHRMLVKCPSKYEASGEAT